MLPVPELAEVPERDEPSCAYEAGKSELKIIPNRIFIKYLRLSTKTSRIDAKRFYKPRAIAMHLEK